MNTIPNLSKACLVLSVLAVRREGVSLLELSQTLKIPRTTTFRILNTFCEHGLVAKEEGNYVTGPELARIGLLSLSGMEIRDHAQPLLAALARDTGETAHLAIPSEQASLILEVCDSPNPLRAASRAGTLADLHASSTGKVFLAFMDEEERETLLKSLALDQRTKNTITTVAALREECEKVRKQGYGIDDEEYFIGIRCLAAPVRNMYGKVIASIGITGTANRFVALRNEEVAQLVLQAASGLSRKLGYTVKSPG
ncbi:MAG: IclR family transcriptional regulator [Verrucomicrobiales bacterium]|jgi:IclR family acetate operon transcriptional repressor|nr:IclR family transcriptional regulator [Verrucomicrobiales bacterium]